MSDISTSELIAECRKQADSGMQHTKYHRGIFAAAAARLEHLDAASRWVPICPDSMPNNGERVNLLSVHGGIAIADYRSGMLRNANWDRDVPIANMHYTHFARIAPPPEPA